jgi:co-chaperonin GroES (HSP10)
MNKVKGKIIPLRDNVIVTDMNFDQQVSKGGIVILSDDGKSEGVKPRWGRVWAVGPLQQDVTVGEWILLEHGRWTRGITVEDENGNDIIVRMVETKSIMMSADERPSELSFGNGIDMSKPSVDPSSFISI